MFSIFVCLAASLPVLRVRSDIPGRCVHAVGVLKEAAGVTWMQKEHQSHPPCRYTERHTGIQAQLQRGGERESEIEKKSEIRNDTDTGCGDKHTSSREGKTEGQEAQRE